MKKPVLITAAIVIALVLAGAYLYFRQSQSNQNNSNSSTGSSLANKLSGKISDLLSSGQSMECTYSYTNEAGTTQGTIYTSGQSLRGNFQGTYDGTQATSHMIRTEDTIYNWTDSSPKGIKMNVSSETETQASTGATPTTSDKSTFDMNQNYDYSCSPWTPDSSLFTPPSNIEFVDLNEQMGVSGASVNQAKTQACSACNAITDPSAQASCKKTLNCE